MAAKPRRPVATDGLVEIQCTCDRIPLADGRVIVRDQRARVPAHEAVNHEAAEKARRV